MTTNNISSLPPWISGEFDIAGLLRGAPRLLTREQFIDHIDRQTEITRRSIDWRFAVFMVNIESLATLESLRGRLVADEFLRSAAECVGRHLNPRDAVAVMRDRCFAVLIEVPLLQLSIEQIAESIQRDIAGIVVEQNLRIEPTSTIGVAKLKRHYFNAVDLIRDAGVALRYARESNPGSVVIFNRAMDAETAIAT